MGEVPRTLDALATTTAGDTALTPPVDGATDATVEAIAEGRAVTALTTGVATLVAAATTGDTPLTLAVDGATEATVEAIAEGRVVAALTTAVTTPGVAARTGDTALTLAVDGVADATVEAIVEASIGTVVATDAKAVAGVDAAVLTAGETVEVTVDNGTATTGLAPIERAATWPLLATVTDAILPVAAVEDDPAVSPTREVEAVGEAMLPIDELRTETPVTETETGAP